MADRETAELCAQIIKYHFGPITSKVAAALLARGRLPLALLTRFTALKPRTIRASLIVLIQHNLVWHVDSPEGPEGRTETYYEVNADEVLMRLRFGRFIENARSTFGDNAGEIVSMILDHGKLRLPDILNNLGATDTKRKGSLTATFHTLLSAHYLHTTSRAAHTSPKDKIIQWEEEEKLKLKAVPSAKQLRDIHERIESRLKMEKEDASTGMKRKATTTGGRAKKRQAVEDDSIDDDVYFRVNYEKFNVHIRNELIVQAATDRYNPLFGHVVRAALQATEAKQRSVEDIRSEPVSTHNISLALPSDLRLRDGLHLLPSQRLSTTSLLKEYLSVLCAADNPTPAGAASAFMARSTAGAGGASEGKVTVEFEVVAARTRKRLVEEVVRDRWGDGAARVLNVLWNSGKMEEKHVAKVAMMTTKDVRAHISSLSSASLLELQQIPKSADRAPGRTFYLWYVSPTKCNQMLLASFYKTCFNLIARCEREEEDKRMVVDKWERSDVQANVGLLTRMEREDLVKLDERRERLWGTLGRVDLNVFMVRDMVGGRTTEGS